MPSYVPRYLEPYQKRELVSKREAHLVHLVKTSQDAAATHRAAERVREAYLNLLKAERALIPPDKLEDAAAVAHLAKVREQVAYWEAISAIDIIARYADT